MFQKHLILLSESNQNTPFTSSSNHTFHPYICSITSYNEWGEGTQIEPARYVSDSEYPPRQYLNYGSSGPYTYLNLTSEFAAKFMARNGEGTEDKNKSEEL